MLGVVFFASALVVASGSKCCIPPQWTGQMSSLIAASNAPGHGAYVRTLDYLAYDAVTHKIGIMQYLTVGDKTTQWAILLDYNTDSRYVINEGKCIRTTLGRTLSDFGGCIPDNATQIGKDSIVGYGDNAAKFDTYAITFADGVGMKLTVTAETCVPVVENIFGSNNGNSFIQNNYYVNISVGIPPETAQNLRSPPTECVNAPTVDAHYTDSFVGKRSLGLLQY